MIRAIIILLSLLMPVKLNGTVTDIYSDIVSVAIGTETYCFYGTDFEIGEQVTVIMYKEQIVDLVTK